MNCVITNQPLPSDTSGHMPEDSIATDDLPAGGSEVIIIRRVPNPDMDTVRETLLTEIEIVKGQLSESGMTPEQIERFATTSTAAKYHALIKDTPAVIETEERRYIHPKAPGEKVAKLAKLLRSRVLLAHAQTSRAAQQQA